MRDDGKVRLAVYLWVTGYCSALAYSAKMGTIIAFLCFVLSIVFAWLSAHLIFQQIEKMKPKG